jgi:hypothetical protein
LWNHPDLKLLIGVVWLSGRVQFRSAEPPVRHAVSVDRRRLRWSMISTTILLTSCEPAGVLDPQGPIASAERLLLINSTAIMLVVVVPVIVATLAFAWWYRSSNTHATRSLDESYEGRVEFVVWSIPGADHNLARRGHLDRLASARSASTDPREI